MNKNLPEQAESSASASAGAVPLGSLTDDELVAKLKATNREYQFALGLTALFEEELARRGLEAAPGPGSQVYAGAARQPGDIRRE